jgi:hypothetical protein
MNQLFLFDSVVDGEPCDDWIAEFHECIAEGISNANLIPYQRGSCPMAAIASVRAALEAEGWVWNEAATQLERDGWFVWFRSQGRTAPPIAQWNELTQPKANW